MGLLQSMSSIAYIGLLLGMLFYLYAVVGVSMFGVNDPVHMGTLHITLLTLFRCATLEDWSDIMYIATTGIAPRRVARACGATCCHRHCVQGATTGVTKASRTSAWRVSQSPSWACCTLHPSWSWPT